MTTNGTSKIMITFAFLSGAFAFYIVNKLFPKKNEKRAEVHDVIMFCYRSAEVKRSKISRCRITRSMDRLLNYLRSPRRSIDICMYVMTNSDVTSIILKLHMRGIKIRVILDADMAFSNGSAFNKMEKQGIPVRWMKSTNLMHHKFCLIDTHTEDARCIPLVVMGSLNWTNQALNGNWEDVAVTSQKKLVEQYKAEFERLWLEFKPIAVVA